LTKRAEDVVILDIRELPGVSDYFVIATGQSEVQTRAIADAVDEGMRARVRPGTPRATRPVAGSSSITSISWCTSSTRALANTTS
jgi:hypothetical protein